MILILGASGRIGGHLFDRFKQEEFSVYGTYCHHKRQKLRYFNLENMALSDLNISPSHVIFGAAVNPRPELSKNTEDSHEVNVTKTIKFIDHCFDKNIVPIYISTDNVFDGKKGNYKETDKTNPLNNYGKMKCEVENHLLASDRPHVLLRMGKVFGIDNTLLLETLNNLKNGVTKPYAIDQLFTPTYAEDLYEFMKGIIENGYLGIFHIGSTKAITRYEVAHKIKKYFHLNMEIPTSSINELGLSEKRPVKIDLNIDKYLELTGKKERDLEYFFEKVIIGINPDKWRRDATGSSLAYFAKTRQVAISQELIENLIRLSANMGNENARFCLHASPGENLQDMIVLAHRGKTCLRPHQHSTGKEAIHIIEGSALALIFDEQHNLIDKRILKSEGEFAYRNNNGTYHIYAPLTDYVILREIRDGKNEPGETAPPEWDWVEVVKEHLSPEYLQCNNAFCKTPCRYKVQISQ